MSRTSESCSSRSNACNVTYTELHGPPVKQKVNNKCRPICNLPTIFTCHLWRKSRSQFKPLPSIKRFSGSLMALLQMKYTQKSQGPSEQRTGFFLAAMLCLKKQQDLQKT